MLRIWNWIFLIWLRYFRYPGAEEIDFQRRVLTEPLLSSDPNDVHFYLFPDKSKPSMKVEILYGDAPSLKTSGIILNAKVRLYIHGLFGNYKTGGCVEIKNAFLKRNYTNIICVDWAKLSGPNIESKASNSLLGLAFFPTVTYKYTNIVAKRIADFLIFLKHQKVLKNYKQVHLIGASLGAQVAGAVGFYIKEQKNGGIGWITGLDPVGPLYEMGLVSQNYKLDKSKADFVNIIHTDAGYFGTKELSGHVDFFVNGGRTRDQPACRNFKDTIFACGHAKSVDYYQRAILGENLLGCRCKFNRKAPFKQPCPKPSTCRPTTKFGILLPESSYGNYYLTVPLNPPPAVGADFVPVHINQ